MRFGLSWNYSLLLLASSLAFVMLWFFGARGKLISIILQIALMLIFAHTFGNLAKRLHQPPVLGEILGGIILGTTIMGTIAPTFQFELLPLFGESSQILQAVSYLGLIALVFTAGLEIELTGIWRQRRSTLITSISGIILPFASGYGVVVLLPGLWSIPSGDTRIFALFMGTALSISALPVIARILLDLDLLKEELGGIIMGAATINDIIGWSIFALILSSLNSSSNLRLNLSLTIGVFLLTACIFCLATKNRGLQKSAIWGIFIDITALAMLIAAIASEFIGAHGIFCAFLAGAILSQRRARRELILKKIYFPVMVILAPIYFSSIGIKTNFIDYFDLAIVLLVFNVACIGKILGAGLGAAASGIEGRKATAIGFGLNARGAMEIVLASAALDYGLIDESVFVALVVMALATTAISGLSLPRLMKMRPISQRAWDPLPLHEQMGSYNYLDS
jgi:Kef-type K+ transport system membrane component KefB